MEVGHLSPTPLEANDAGFRLLLRTGIGAVVRSGWLAAAGLWALLASPFLLALWMLATF